MNTYYKYLFLLLSSLVLTASSCDKDKEPDLVPITTTGENTMGFYLDGVPYNKKGVLSFGRPSGVAWGKYADGKLELSGGGGNPHGYIRINFYEVPHTKQYLISTLSQGNGGQAEFVDDDIFEGNDYYTNDTITGIMEILRLDENIISGTFDIRLQHPSTKKIIHLTDGRFDIKR